MVKIYTELSSVLTFIMNVGRLQDTVYQDPAQLYYPQFNHLTLLHYVNFINKVTNLVLCDTAFGLMIA